MCYNLNIRTKRIRNMKIVNDQSGQGIAEYILVFGAIIVIAVAALIYYNSYSSPQHSNSPQQSSNHQSSGDSQSLSYSVDISKVRSSVK